MCVCVHRHAAGGGLKAGCVPAGAARRHCCSAEHYLGPQGPPPTKHAQVFVPTVWLLVFIRAEIMKT